VSKTRYLLYDIMSGIHAGQAVTLFGLSPHGLSETGCGGQ